jgi:hypothetical protein
MWSVVTHCAGLRVGLSTGKAKRGSPEEVDKAIPPQRGAQGGERGCGELCDRRGEQGGRERQDQGSFCFLPALLSRRDLCPVCQQWQRGEVPRKE